MTTEQSNLQELAKQGNSKAIAALLNRFLQPKGITAKAAIKNNCLHLMLEAAQVPPKQPYVDSLRKGLTKLIPTAIQKIKIYGKQVSEDLPEWVEEFDFSLQPLQDLPTLAQQGDLKAINTLVNQWVQPYGAIAKVRLKSDSLLVMLESQEILDQQTMIGLINAEVSKLEISSIQTMKVFGKQIDEEFPDWHQNISFEPKLERPLPQVGISETLISNTDVQSRELVSPSKINEIQLSNQIYEALKDTLNEPFLKREEEEQEKDIHEAVRDFIDNLEFDLKLASELAIKQLTKISKSLGLNLDSVEINSHIFDIYDTNFLKIKSIIKQLDKVTNEVLNYSFTQEENSLFNWDVATGASLGWVTGGIMGSVIGAFSSWQNKKEEQEEKQLVLEKYKKCRENLFQVWVEILQLFYKVISNIMLKHHNLKLTEYQYLRRAEELCEKAMEYLENQKFEDAITVCDQAIELNSFLIYSWHFKGCALYNIDRHEEAIKDFDRALKIDEKFILAWQNKGDSLQKLGRDEQAIVAYENAISLDGNNYYSWLNKSISLCNIQRYSEAIKACEIAISIEPEDYEGWYVKACCAALIKDSEQVLENLQKALNFNREECRTQVKDNSSFDFLKNNEKFKNLIEESSVGIDYSELKHLLAEKQWKQADQETARIMYLAAQLSILALLDEDEQEELLSLNLEEISQELASQELDDNSIQNFPCEDLNTLDKLWIEHSDEKFGFSIQKEIYQGLGGTHAFNGEIRDKFGNQTGWRVCKNDQYSWRRSDLFIYDFEKAPRGHLPSCLWAGKEDGWFSNRRDKLIALFSRMDACSISNLPKK